MHRSAFCSSSNGDNNRVAEYLIRETRVALNAGANLGTVGQLRFGRLDRELRSSIETGSTSLPTGKTHIRGWNTALELDQFDRAFFPSKGWAAHLSYFKENNQGYSKLSADLQAAHSWRDYVVNGKFTYLNAPQGKLPVADAGALGGFLNLSGFTLNQILAGDIRFAIIRGEKITRRMPVGLSGDLRVGLSLETGKARNRFTETNLEGWQQAASIYLGGETPLGPLFLDTAWPREEHQACICSLACPGSYRQTGDRIFLRDALVELEEGSEKNSEVET